MDAHHATIAGRKDEDSSEFVILGRVDNPGPSGTRMKMLKITRNKRSHISFSKKSPRKW